jgi:dTDP-4-dehydrorhamnose 3,5-epimerase
VKFAQTPLAGAYVIEPEPREDARGFFATLFTHKDFAALGLKADVVECAISYNRAKGTVRGMHYQAQPQEQPKLVRCTRGSMYDAIVDLRRHSPTFQKWFAVELTARNCKTLYIPEGMAHGFQTLEDETEVLYHLYASYAPDCERGVRWNDPAFGIRWPLKVSIISARDESYPDFKG